MTLAENNRLSLDTARLNVSVGKLEALNPLAILSRGYSAVYNAEGSVIKTTAQIKVGQTVTLHLADGEADAEVRSVRITGNEE